jgi:formate--tetrahydrofolate ligase
MTYDFMIDILQLGKSIGISEEFIIPYGKNMAKVDLSAMKKIKGKLILVTAITPTKFGEGKTTTTIGIAQSLKKIGKNVSISLREPSMGPCFGVKGGATGGGKSKVEPSDKINLLFTGDFPAISAAHNLLSAMINNHIFQGNKLKIDPNKILFPRTIDMNDRSLREVIVGLGAKGGTLGKDIFVITPASEIMAILGFVKDYEDLLKRLSRIIVAMSYDGKPIRCSDLNVHGAMAAILVDAIKPNLVQTTEGVPAFIHTGPFGNIAAGTSSLIATKMALGYSDYVLVEAGFGSDLGAEKFINMVSRIGQLEISCVVLVVTLRAIKAIGEGMDAEGDPIKLGLTNLIKHRQNLISWGFDPLVVINKFSSDDKNEMDKLLNCLTDESIDYGFSEVFEKGGDGGIEIAEKIVKISSTKLKEIRYTYDFYDGLKEKIEKIGKNVYGADYVIFRSKALKSLRDVENIGGNTLPICMAKTQYSFSDNPDGVDVRKKFNIEVTDISLKDGAGFIVVYLGEIMTMPGLPKKPAAEDISIDLGGNILNLF